MYYLFPVLHLLRSFLFTLSSLRNLIPASRIIEVTQPGTPYYLLRSAGRQTLLPSGHSNCSSLLWASFRVSADQPRKERLPCVRSTSADIVLLHK